MSAEKFSHKKVFSEEKRLITILLWNNNNIYKNTNPGKDIFSEWNNRQI